MRDELHTARDADAVTEGYEIGLPGKLLELCVNLGDDGLREAAYRGG
jgi:hypothetical protein